MAVSTSSQISTAQAQRLATNSALGVGLSKLATMAVLIFGSIVFLVPFYVMVTISLKSEAELGTSSIWALPKHPTLENFRYVLENPNVSFQLFLKNTIFVSTLTTIGVVVSSAAVAYAFARLQFAGRDRLFLILLSTMMLPGIVTMIPTYVLYANIGWVNTFKPLIVPAYFGGGAFNIFLLRQFFLGIPTELDEAAVLDGAGYFTIFTRIIFPLSGPALATVGIFTFMGSWKDFMGPLLYLNDPVLQTNELGLSTYNALQSSKWHLVMAGSVLVMIPIVILFFVGQKFFVKGITMGGVK